jgi:tetratricopeptide (TPR) repeat protein
MSHILRLAPLLCLLIASCASRDSGWEKKTDSVSISTSEVNSLTKEAMELWKARLDQGKLQEALAKFERLHAANPNDLQTLIYLTRGNYFLADSHLQEIEEKKKIYELAASYGEKAMATNPEFKEAVKSGKSVEEAVTTLTEAEVPAIYWTAASLGKWAKATGIAAALKYKTRIKAMVERVEKLKPDYFFGAPSRYWGGFYAVAPSFAGGDMKKSKIQFDKSLQMAPEYQGTKVLMAEVYYTKEGKKKEFEMSLKEVLASKFDNHPEIGPENALEKKKAERLLAKMDDLF